MGIFSRSSKKNNQPEEASLLKYLASMSPDDIDRLITIAQNNYNDRAKDHGKSMTDYFDLLKSVFNSTNFNSVNSTPHTRNQRYEIYDEMDESTAYISSALDILSDDATQVDEDGKIIHIESDSPKIVAIVEKLFIEFDIEEKISKWTRAVAKYGDLFVKVEGAYGEGVQYVNDTIYPGIIDRRDLNGKLLAFADNQDTVYNNDNLYAPWDFVHFRHKGDIYAEESKSARLGLDQNRLEKSLTSAYGQSILRPAIKVYAQLRFVENMILLSRLTNSIRRNIFLVNVGDVAPDKAYEVIANYANLIKKDINLNIEDGIYSSQRHTINYDEDIFIPVSDPQNDVRIEQVGGDANIEEQYDLEYLLNKLFSSLKIPKAYLNYEQDLNARSTLIQLDIRYARSVGQLQNTMSAGLLRLAKIHLAYLGFNPDEIDLDIHLTSVSAIDEEARTEQRQKQISNARDIWDLATSMNDALQGAESPEGETTVSMNLQVLSEYLMSDYLELNQDIIDRIFNRKKPDEDEEKMTRIRSHRIYRDTDVYESYPTKEEVLNYERIREALINKTDDTETISKVR